MRVVPDPRPQALLGWVAFAVSWVCAGAFAFVVGVAIAKRRWELGR